MAHGSYPQAFAKYLAQVPFRGKLFSGSTEGSYLEFHFPELKLYGDSRFPREDAMAVFINAMTSAESFQRLDAQVRFDGALVPVDLGHEVVKLLLKMPKEWEFVYSDLRLAFFVRKASFPGHAFAKQFRFYDGERLSRVYDGAAAITWAMVLVSHGDSKLFRGFLDELDKSPVVPAPVLSVALRYVISHKDTESLSRIARLKGKAVSRSPAEFAEISNLWRLIPAQVLKEL